MKIAYQGWTINVPTDANVRVVERPSDGLHVVSQDIAPGSQLANTVLPGINITGVEYQINYLTREIPIGTPPSPDTYSIAWYQGNTFVSLRGLSEDVAAEVDAWASAAPDAINLKHYLKTKEKK